MRHHYGLQCDSWSCGVLMYVLLCGYPPFHGASKDEVLQKVATGKYVFVKEDWAGISAEAKDLIRSLLRLDPAGRCTPGDALRNPWARSPAPKPKLAAKGPPLLA